MGPCRLLPIPSAVEEVDLFFAVQLAACAAVSSCLHWFSEKMQRHWKKSHHVERERSSRRVLDLEGMPVSGSALQSSC